LIYFPSQGGDFKELYIKLYFGVLGIAPGTPTDIATTDMTENNNEINQNGSQQASVAISRVSNGAEEGVVCFDCVIPGCDRSFPTKRGLGVHMTRAHKAAANSQIVVPKSKLRWSDEELRLVAFEEARLVRLGGGNINKELGRLFPARTLESIKGQRRKDEYKKMVQELLGEPASCPPESGVGGMNDDVVDEDGSGDPLLAVAGELHNLVTDPRGRIADKILQLTEAAPSGGFQAQRLWSIAKDMINGEDVSCRLDMYCAEVLSARKGGMKTGARKIVRFGRNTTRRQIRRQEYAILQKLWCRNRTAAAEKVLNGTPAAYKGDSDEFIGFWENLFTGEVTSGADVNLTCQVETIEVMSPIDEGDIKEAYPKSGTSPGPDGMTCMNLKRMPRRTVAVLFNVFLYIRRIPKSLAQARTVFLAKTNNPISPSEFRPLSIPSVVTRCFHKILAKRMSGLDSIHEAQRAFRPADGCFENVTTLEAILTDARKRRKELHMVSIDLRKAFDSVYFPAIIESAHKLTGDTGFTEYLKNLYEDQSTVIEFNGKSRKVKPTKGVRQGDPLSPGLFNGVIDGLITNLPSEVGYRICGRICNVIAFADDIVFFSSSRVGMERLLEKCVQYFESRGLSINAAKSASLSLIPAGKSKKLKVITDRPFTVKGEVIPVIDCLKKWKYLGMMFTSEGIHSNDRAAQLKKYMERIGKSPTKPQQKIYIMQNHVIPKLMYELVLRRSSRKELEQLDNIVRNYMRGWLKLTKDVPWAYFHTPASMGGLSSSSFRCAVPWTRHERLMRLSESKSEFVRKMGDLEYVERSKELSRQMCTVEGVQLDTKLNMQKGLRSIMLKRFDARPLRDANKVPSAHRWVTEATNLMRGAEYIDAVRTRINDLPTASRLSRGQPARRKNCRHRCNAVETLDHMAQRCPATHRTRINRHDAIVKLVQNRLENKGFDVQKEPVIRTNAGTRKPDLVAKKGESKVMLDVQVIGGSIDLETANNNKKMYYQGNMDLTNQLSEEGRYQISTIGITVNLVGVMCRTSANELLRMGISRQDMKIMSIRALNGTNKCFERSVMMVTR
jgi:hypothetical protein